MRKPRNYWTKERVFEEARKYETKNAFRKGCMSAYLYAHRNKWIDEMYFFKNIYKSWTKEKVFEEAKKYTTRTEFANNAHYVYETARENGWLDEMPWLVDGIAKLFTDKIDCVYKYYWEETNSIYIGRTICQNVRDRVHIFNDRDTVHKYAKENGLAVPPMEIIEDNLTLEEGLDREDYWKNYYKEKGYNVLNTAKTGIGSGSLGTIGGWKWSNEKILAEAKKYNTAAEFKKGCSGAYYAARHKKLFEKIDWFKDDRYTKNKHNSKSILQIDINTNKVIAEFPSTMEVQRQLGFSQSCISCCCMGKFKQSYGYIWKYKEESAA